jgi:hypothetical protein
MMDRCYGCGRGMDPIVVRLGDPLPVMPSRMIYPTTSRGSIAFCNLCFEGQRFGALTPDDVERITWFFGAAFADEQPERAVELLEPMLAKWRAPDLLSPLGRAYLGVGRVAEGRAMLREALSLNPEHPYSSSPWLKALRPLRPNRRWR